MKIKALFFASTLLFTSFSFAQVTASFVADTVCFGSVTSLISTSSATVGSITNFNWDLNGDGQFNNAVGSSINFQFDNAGSYTVGLQVITDLSDTAETTMDVLVNERPTANFAATAVCDGNATLFLNTSFIATDSIVGYSWSFGDNNSSSERLPTHQYATTGNFTVNLTVTAENGCTDSEAGTATVRELPTAEIIVSGSTELCETDTALLIASTNASTFFWSNGLGGDTLVATQEEEYILIATDQFGCVNRANVFVEELNPPVVLEIRDTAIVKGNSIELTVDGNAATYTWTPSNTLNTDNGTKVVASPTEFTTYYVTGTSSKGCTTTKKVHVRVDEDYTINYTNVITPNGDGVNDIFRIRNIHRFQFCPLRIYNRYGDMVFSRQDYRNDWQGTYDGQPLPEDTYYFTIDCADIENNQFTGAITIIR